MVSIRIEGDELAFFGGGRVFRTNQCYDPMPTLTRETHSRDANGKTWRTRCTTPANDPRKAILNTLVVATTDTHIDVIETGRYEVEVAIGPLPRRREADARVRSRLRRGTQGAERRPRDRAAARGEVRAEVDRLRFAGRSFAARSTSFAEAAADRRVVRLQGALVLDDKGCATKTATTWKLAPGAEAKGVTVDPNGNVTIAKDAPEAPSRSSCPPRAKTRA